MAERQKLLMMALGVRFKCILLISLAPGAKTKEVFNSKTINGVSFCSFAVRVYSVPLAAAQIAKFPAIFLSQTRKVARMLKLFSPHWDERDKHRTQDTGDVFEIKHHITDEVQLGRRHQMDTHSAGRRRREGCLMRSITGGGWEPSQCLTSTLGPALQMLSSSVLIHISSFLSQLHTEEQRMQVNFHATRHLLCGDWPFAAAVSPL